MPVQALGDRAADQRATGDGQPGHAAPDADHGAAPLGREGRGQQGQAEGHDDGGADALDGAAGDQRPDVRGQRAGGRGHREHGQAQQVHAAPPDQVAERGGGDDAGPEGQHVGVDRPLQGPDVPAQVAVDGGQRGHHDQGVQCHHEVGHRGEQHGQDPARGTGTWPLRTYGGELKCVSHDRITFLRMGRPGRAGEKVGRRATRLRVGRCPYR